MIGRDDHDGVVEESAALELREEDLDLGIDTRDLAIVEARIVSKVVSNPRGIRVRRRHLLSDRGGEYVWWLGGEHPTAVRLRRLVGAVWLHELEVQERRLCTPRMPAGILQPLQRVLPKLRSREPIRVLRV
jgi:hypothetical protein